MVLTRLQMRLADPKHEWTYRNAWFVYQYDMPCIVKRRQKGVMA